MKTSISQIGKDERQELFDTFVAHGGKVVDKEKETVIDRRTQSREKPKGTSTNMSLFKDELDKTRSVKDAIADFQSKDVSRKVVLVPDEYVERVKRKEQLKGASAFFRKFSAFISGITDFSGKSIQSRFSRETYIILAEDIANLKAITGFIVGSSLFRRLDIVRSFAGTYPIFTEIILRINALKLDQVTPRFKSQAPFSLESCKIYYFMIIKSFFPFFGRKEMVLSAFSQCFRVLKQLQLYNKQFLATEEERLHKAIKNIFDSYLPKLNKLYPLLIQKDVEIISPISKHVLELTEVDFLGSWGAKIQEVISHADAKLDESEESDDSVSSSEESEGQESLEQGMKMINTIVLDESNIYQEIISYPRRDKIFITAYLLDFCAKRYWILNNRKYIEYKPAQENGERFSLEILINEFFINIEKFHVTLKNYSQILTSLLGFNPDIDAPKDGLMVISREEENLQEIRAKLNKQLREQVVSFIGAIVLPLGQRREYLSRYIQNPDMDFDSSLFKDNPFTVYTPLGIIQDFYQFIKAFHYLITRGELSGNSNIVPLSSKLLHLNEEV